MKGEHKSCGPYTCPVLSTIKPQNVSKLTRRPRPQGRPEFRNQTEQYAKTNKTGHYLPRNPVVHAGAKPVLLVFDVQAQGK